MTEKQMIKLQFASNSVMWKVTAHGLISVTDSALNVHRGRKRAKQCRWESWKNRGGRQGGHWVQKRGWGGNTGGSETEKLISTLHCLLLPSVKDYPTAAEYRGALHTEGGGHRCGGKHTCTHTCAQTHSDKLGVKHSVIGFYRLTQTHLPANTFVKTSKQHGTCCSQHVRMQGEEICFPLDGCSYKNRRNTNAKQK